MLEAMASSCFILSHDNVFNHTVLGENAVYYNNQEDVKNILNNLDALVAHHKQQYTERNLEVIRNDYSWEKLIDEHEKYFEWMLEDANMKRR